MFRCTVKTAQTNSQQQIFPEKKYFRIFHHLPSNTMSHSDQGEDGTDGYEIIETPGSRHLVEQLISMDLAERPAVQQITIGGISGWFAGYVCKRVGKVTLSAIGGGILVLQIAYRAGYININWKRMEKDMDKITKKVEKQVKKIRKNDDVEKGIIALANRGYKYARRNMAAASGFAGGFLLGFVL